MKHEQNKCSTACSRWHRNNSVPYKTSEESRTIKKKAIVIIFTLLFSLAADTLIASFASPNPFTNSRYSGETGAPSSAPSPIVSIFSIDKDKVYNTGTIVLSFNATVDEFSEGGYSSPLLRGMRIAESFYTADWLQNITPINISTYLNPESSNKLSVSLNLTDIPDGKHTLRVYVVAYGTITDPFHWYEFKKAGYSRVDFTIDTTPPKVTVFPISPIDSDVQLDFAVNNATSKYSYVLDGNNNVTISGNTTLTKLSEELHSITVYAWDKAGNMGTSETILFNVEAPDAFPTVTIAVASGTGVALLIVSLFIYRKKTKRPL